MMKVFLKRFVYVSAGLLFYGMQARTEIQHPLDGRPKAIKVIDISHHKGVVGERITFRFNGEPLFNHLPAVPGVENKLKGTIQEHHFFLPQTILKGESTKKFAQQMNATVYPTYSISLEAVSVPMEGLLCIITFDSSKVGFQLESGVSPSGHRSIAFTFYDRGKLHVINARHSTVLNLAHLDGDCQIKKKYV